MKRILLLLIFALIVLVFFSGIFWFYEVRFKVGRANITSYSFSVDNSYVFITPLRAKANNQERVRVTVFVLNNQGLGVAGKKAFLAPSANLSVETVQSLTDAYGKSYFDVTANKAGEYFLEVKVDDTPLKQKAHLSFY